jgi:prepilin-type processing-associated H-X9-DG protein
MPPAKPPAPAMKTPRPARSRPAFTLITTGPSYPYQRDTIKATNKRHRGRFNLVFCDGHVENMDQRKLFTTNAVALRRCSNDNEAHPDQISNF